MAIELAVAAGFFALFFIVPVGLGIWVGLGESNPFVRVLVLLGGITAMGFFFQPSRSSNDTAAGLGLFFTTLVCCGIVWIMPSRRSKIVSTILLVGIHSFVVVKELGRINARPAGIIYIGAGIVAISAIACLYRMNGFRVLRLTRDCDDQELEIGTGRTLDAWIKYLNQQNAENLTRAEIVSLLREDGVPFAWQRVLVDAYECVIGRSMVGQDESGRPQTVADNANVRIRDLLTNNDGKYRWSIRQIMFLSFAVAAIAALLSRLGVSADPIELAIFVFWSIGLGMIALSTVHTTLKVNRSRKSLLAVALTVFGFATAGWLSIFYSRARPPVAVVDLWIGILCCGGFFALYFTMVAYVVRNRGYRLVVVRRGRTPLCSADE